jgi:hypothetical protein
MANNDQNIQVKYGVDDADVDKDDEGRAFV